MRYPDVIFLGKKSQQDIARILQTMDVFAWPSLTDTFGLVVLEAMASGLPVAAFRNEVNEHIIEHRRSGILIDVEEDFGVAIDDAFNLIRPTDAVERAKKFSWEAATDQFISHLI